MPALFMVPPFLYLILERKDIERRKIFRIRKGKGDFFSDSEKNAGQDRHNVAIAFSVLEKAMADTWHICPWLKRRHLDNAMDSTLPGMKDRSIITRRALSLDKASAPDPFHLSCLRNGLLQGPCPCSSLAAVIF